MASSRLSDIRKFLAKGEDQTSGPYSCYVTNFDSPFPWPRKHTYKGCNHPRFKGFSCGKLIEGGSDCKHDRFDPMLEGNHRLLFRLYVMLVDANHGGVPLKACIFEAAKNIIELGPEEFQRIGEDGQIALLHAIAMETPLVSVWIRTKEDGSCIVQKLDKVIALDSPPTSPPQVFNSPARTGFTTPRSSRQVESGAGSSSRVSQSAREQRSISKKDDPTLQRSLAHVMDFLGSLSTRDDE